MPNWGILLAKGLYYYQYYPNPNARLPWLRTVYYMKNLDYYTRISYSGEAEKGTYLSLIQRDISGGRINRQEIDTISQYPSAIEIAISGLTQDTFEYFVEKYGGQFKAIVFWKCPLVQDFKALELLEKVEYIVYFWNQRVNKLWDFSKTKALKGFCFQDFTRMHNIDEISESPLLEELQFGDMIWNKYILNSLQPLQACSSLLSLSFSAKKILDGKIEPISYLKKIHTLKFPSNLFSTEQIAWLKAHLPDTLTSISLQAYWTMTDPIDMNGKHKDTLIIGKGKPLLDSIQEKDRLAKYISQFDDMYGWFIENPTAGPNDYRGTG
jgi:hypothetical protein